MSIPGANSAHMIPLWDAEVVTILERQQQDGNSDSNVATTHAYLTQYKAFPTIESARAAKNLVNAFNERVTSAVNLGLEAPHPFLLPAEYTTLFRLRIYDCDRAFMYIPNFETKWETYRSYLQQLLTDIQQYAQPGQGEL